MKLHYYPDTDSLYVEFKSEPGVETREIADGLNVDLDGEGRSGGLRHRPRGRTSRPHHLGNRSASRPGLQGRLIRAKILPSPMPVRHAFTGYLLSTYSATIRVNCSDSSAAVPRSVVNWRPST